MNGTDPSGNAQWVRGGGGLTCYGVTNSFAVDDNGWKETTYVNMCIIEPGYGERFDRNEGGGGGGGGSGTQSPQSILGNLRDLYCALPSFGLSGTLRGYDFLGGGAVIDVNFDPKSGRLGATAGPDVGIGFGGEAGAIARGTNATLGRNVPNGFSGSVGVNANFRLGPIAGGVSETLISRNGSGFGGVSGGIRPGATGATVNANIGARVGYGGQIAPACKK